MRFTTWAEYGLIVSVHLARRGGRQPIPVRDMAESERLPADYLEQILLKLRRAGLVSSVRGANGGYYLARDAVAITVRDVVEAVEHRTFEVNCDCYRVDAERCGPGNECTIRPVWRELQRRIDDLLDAVSLADLLRHEADVEELVAITARS